MIHCEICDWYNIVYIILTSCASFQVYNVHILSSQHRYDVQFRVISIPSYTNRACIVQNVIIAMLDDIGLILFKHRVPVIQFLFFTSSIVVQWKVCIVTPCDLHRSDLTYNHDGKFTSSWHHVCPSLTYTVVSLLFKGINFSG